MQSPPGNLLLMLAMSVLLTEAAVEAISRQLSGHVGRMYLALVRTILHARAASMMH